MYYDFYTYRWIVDQGSFMSRQFMLKEVLILGTILQIQFSVCMWQQYELLIPRHVHDTAFVYSGGSWCFVIEQFEILLLYMYQYKLIWICFNLFCSLIESASTGVSRVFKPIIDESIFTPRSE